MACLEIRSRKCANCNTAASQLNQKQTSKAQRTQRKQVARKTCAALIQHRSDELLLPPKGLPSAGVFARPPQENAQDSTGDRIYRSCALSCGGRAKTLQRKALAPSVAARARRPCWYAEHLEKFFEFFEALRYVRWKLTLTSNCIPCIIAWFITVFP